MLRRSQRGPVEKTKVLKTFFGFQTFLRKKNFWSYSTSWPCRKTWTWTVNFKKNAETVLRVAFISALKTNLNFEDQKFFHRYIYQVRPFLLQSFFLFSKSHFKQFQLPKKLPSAFLCFVCFFVAVLAVAFLVKIMKIEQELDEEASLR